MSLSKVTIATTFCLLGSLIANHRANASTLFIGSYGSFAQDINTVGFIPQSKVLTKLIAQQTQKSSTLDRKKLKKEELIKQIDALASAEPLKKQIEEEYISFEQNPSSTSTNNNQKSSESTKKSLNGITNAEQINANIDERYHGLIETNEEKIDLFQANKINQELVGSQATNNPSDSSSIQNIVDSTENVNSQNIEDTTVLPEYFKAGIFMLIVTGGCLFSLPIITAFGSSDSQGVMAFLGGKYSKPKVPDNVISLHQKTFKQINNFARKAERIDDDKFGNQEFTLYVKLRDKVEQGAEEYRKVCQSIKYLEVAIAAQGSYLKLEQTELRYRSRQQQVFYKFVTDSITDDVDKNTFKDAVKKKLAEVIPLVTSEEGRNALKSYLKEIDKIAQHDLGLKLLGLFKKYQLADFTILRKVADIVEKVNSQEVLNDKNLTAIILENYDTLKKLAPIIQIESDDINPETFNKILQYMGLVRRHEKSFSQFKNLMSVLNKWQEPFDSLKLIREQYPKHEYKVPSEFTEKIPGIAVYEKYKKYLAQFK